MLSGIEGIVLGRAVKVEKHPEADKLYVIQVDVGTEVVQIITGADNVTEGAVVPVVLDGGVLPDGRKIEKGKLRGLESNGMLCSAQELGCEDKVVPVAVRDGIWILEDLGFAPGSDFAEKAFIPLFDKHCISVTEEHVSFLNCLPVSLKDLILIVQG